MCGIAGLLARRDLQVSRQDADRLAKTLSHRGPDGEGVWSNPSRDCLLVHRRLAILDPTSASDQPMTDQLGRYTITFNGEIYNFLELKRELEALGARFRTNGDTEVILLGWRQWGKALLPKMNGMWAFAIHDAADGSTTMVRDRFGVKPLYYAIGDKYM